MYCRSAMYLLSAIVLSTSSVASSAADAPAATAPPAAFAGTWRFDPARSSGAETVADSPTSPKPAGTESPHHRGGSHSAGGTGGGMGGGMGGGHGGGGSRHPDRGGTPATATAHAGDHAPNDRSLERMYADHMVISVLAKPARIRFDAGSTPVELGLDGMNVSGPGVGGTLALSSSSPDLVIDTVTDSGDSLSEHYHLMDDGHHLELQIHLKKSGASSATDTTRVFDRAAAAAAPAA